MKALVYGGPSHVSVEDVPDARIERPTDVLVKITTTNICGSDLHMFEGRRTELEPGRILGHENMGEVVETGEGVDRVRVGDFVSLPLNISCGFCRNCEAGKTAYCLTTNPGPHRAGAAYGFAGMGEHSGGQAELLHVPYGDHNCLVLPEEARSRQSDYTMLSDDLPSGWHATELAGLQAGESVVIYGAGPVGLMAALSANLKGASQVMVVDRHPERLELAEQAGAIAVNDSAVSPVEVIEELTHGAGADRGCECVGYQAHDDQGREQPNLTLNDLVHAVRPTGGIGVAGEFVPRDPGGHDKLYQEGEFTFDYGLHWSKGQTMGSGHCSVKAYNRQLCKLIEQRKAEPSWIVSHELELSDAPDGYQHFDDRDEGWTKVLLHPDGSHP